MIDITPLNKLIAKAIDKSVYDQAIPEINKVSDKMLSLQTMLSDLALGGVVNFASPEYEQAYNLLNVGKEFSDGAIDDQFENFLRVTGLSSSFEIGQEITNPAIKNLFVVANYYFNKCISSISSTLTQVGFKLV